MPDYVHSGRRARKAVKSYGRVIFEVCVFLLAVGTRDSGSNDLQYDKDSRCRPHPNTLLFERLPDSYTEPLLLEMLAPYGRLLTTKLMSLEDTKLASVTFETGLEARRALLALDGSLLCGRPIQASFDERGETALCYKPSVTHISN